RHAGSAGDRPAGAARGDACVVRDLHGRVRQLPGRDRRQDGHGRKGRRPGRRHRAALQPVVVVRLRPVRQTFDRRLRLDRERRSRRHGCSADRAEGVRGVLQKEGAVARRDLQRLMVDYSGTATDRARTRARRAAYATELSFLRRRDWLLAAAVAALVGYGLWAINGITHHDVEGSPHYFFARQATFAAAGAVAFAIALAIDPSRWARYWRPVYGGTVAVMVLVFLAGPVTRGSQRWLDIGSLRSLASQFAAI